MVFELEKNSIEEGLFYLQNLGLEINDYKNYTDSVPIDTYESLLDFTIDVLQKFEAYGNNVQILLKELEKSNR